VLVCRRLQGLTVGAKQSIKRLMIQWSVEAEKKWPGILYVAVSRAQDVRDVLFDWDLTASDLNLNRADSFLWNAQTRQMERVIGLASAGRRDRLVSDDQYLADIEQFCISTRARMRASHRPGPHDADIQRVLDQWLESVAFARAGQADLLTCDQCMHV
jgi:hypothetical protein